MFQRQRPCSSVTVTIFYYAHQSLSSVKRLFRGSNANVHAQSSESLLATWLPLQKHSIIGGFSTRLKHHFLVSSVSFQIRFHVSSKNIKNEEKQAGIDRNGAEKQSPDTVTGRHWVALQMTECFRNSSQVAKSDGDD
jgi:hypothetical protein